MSLQAFFCDEAATDSGRLHIHGIFYELMARGFPARQEQLVLCGEIEWQPGDAGKQKFVVDLLDPDGQSVFTVEGHTDVSEQQPGRAPAHTHLILPLTNVVFPTAGRYQTRFLLRGSEVAGPSLYLSDSREIPT